MTPDDLPEGLRGLTPDEVLTFLREAGDDELRDRVHAIGTGTVLGLVFDAWAARVGRRGSRAAGLLAFVLDDDGTEHRHALAVSPDGARHDAAPTAPRATVSTTLVRFLRVAAGAQDPKRLVVTGRLRLGGDVLWAVTTLAGLSPS